MFSQAFLKQQMQIRVTELGEEFKVSNGWISRFFNFFSREEVLRLEELEKKAYEDEFDRCFDLELDEAGEDS